MGTETRIGIVAGLLIVVVASVYFFYGNNRKDEEILVAALPKPVEPLRIPIPVDHKPAPARTPAITPSRLQPNPSTPAAQTPKPVPLVQAPKPAPSPIINVPQTVTTPSARTPMVQAGALPRRLRKTWRASRKCSITRFTPELPDPTTSTGSCGTISCAASLIRLTSR